MIYTASCHLRHLIQERIRRTVIGHEVPVDVPQEAVISHIVGQQTDQHIPPGGVVEHSSAAILISMTEMCRCVKIIDAIIIGKGLHSSAPLFRFYGIPQGPLSHKLHSMSLDHVHLCPWARADWRWMVTHLNILPI